MHGGGRSWNGHLWWPSTFCYFNGHSDTGAAAPVSIVAPQCHFEFLEALRLTYEVISWWSACPQSESPPSSVAFPIYLPFRLQPSGGETWLAWGETRRFAGENEAVTRSAAPRNHFWVTVCVCALSCCSLCVWGGGTFYSSRSFESALVGMSIYTRRGQKDSPPSFLRLHAKREGKDDLWLFQEFI